MIREALVNDAALFVGSETKGVLRTRPRRCPHLFDGLPLMRGAQKTAGDKLDDSSMEDPVAGSSNSPLANQS